MSDRQKPVDYLKKYIGIKEGSAKHKEILAVFNDSGLCTRYKMTTKDSWCATGVSAAFIATGLSKIFPCVECSCGKMIELAKKHGIWVENDAYRPGAGDVVMYDWDDTGKGDNTGWPKHVGLVASVSGSIIKVIECNKSDTVGYRTLAVNGKYIRGYITPKFGTSSSSSSSGSKKTIEAIAKEVMAGKWGVQPERQKKLEAAGYDYETVRKRVNELMGKKSSGTSSSAGSSKPSYKVGETYSLKVDRLAVRSGAGTGYSRKSYSQLTSNAKQNAYSDGYLKKGTKVTCKQIKTVGNDIWIKIPSGWCAAYYKGKAYIK